MKATAFSTIATASSFVARSAANDELKPEVMKAAQAISTVSGFGTGCLLLSSHRRKTAAARTNEPPFSFNASHGRLPVQISSMPTMSTSPLVGGHRKSAEACGAAQLLLRCGPEISPAHATPSIQNKLTQAPGEERWRHGEKLQCDELLNPAVEEVIGSRRRRRYRSRC